MGRTFRILLLIILLSFFTYSKILSNGLFFDDEELIYKNSYVKNFNLVKLFSENMIAGAGKVSNMYRPLLMTTFSIDTHIWNGNPFGFHLVSIFLHAINGILLFFLSRKLFKSSFLSLVATSLFIIHPIQSEAISYASGRTDPLYALFFLSAIFFYLRYKDSGKLLAYSLSLLLFIFSLLSKEVAIILPLVLLLCSNVYCQQAKSVGIKAYLPTLPFFFVSVIYSLFRLTLFNFQNSLNFYTTINIYSQNIFVRLLTFSRVFFEYLGLLIFPKGLIVARNVPIITSPFNIWVIFFIITILIGSIMTFYFRKKTTIFLFCFLWFFITILPVSGVIPINNIMTEHYLYLPSISFFLFVGFFLSYIYSRLNRLYRPIFITVITILFSSLILRTVIRTYDWKDPITFYTKSLQQSPWHIPMRANLAMTYADKGDTNLAINEYKSIIESADIYPQVHHNLGNAYKSQKKYDDAEKEYLLAIKMDSNFLFSYAALADLYQKTGDKEKFDQVVKKLNSLQNNR